MIEKDNVPETDFTFFRNSQLQKRAIILMMKDVSRRVEGVRKGREGGCVRYPISHTEVMTIMRCCGQILEILLRRSGASRERWLSENSHGGKICST